ncbi:MAG TPA: MFS transporter [Streptosporangiaceae bacterium]|nr:MFS transporter [Streptosporangiaceae bacterium]
MLERKWWTLIAGCTAIFMLLLDVTIVNVALPSIQRGLHASFSDLQWVIDGYALTLASALLGAGSLADRVGRRRVFTLGLTVFTAASLMSGLAASPLWLELARGAQGIGGAMMFGTSLALIAQEFHGRERGVALGVWGATSAAAVSTGPLAGGLLTQALSWRWIFLVNVPIGIAAIALTRRRLTESRDEQARGLDLPGLAALSAGLFLLVFSLIRGNDQGWTSPVIAGSLAGAAASMGLFLAIEARARQPLLDLGLFRKPAFTGAALAGFCLHASVFSLFLYISLFFQNILGYTPLQAGLRQLPVTALLLLVAPASGRLSTWIPPRLLMGTGLSLVSLGLFLMHWLTVTSGWTALLPGQILAGVGVGLTTPALAATAVGVAPPARSGMASAANNTARQLGIATGIAALGAVFQHKILATLGPLLAGTAAAGHASRLARAVAAGGSRSALLQAPPAARAALGRAAHQAFVTGFNEIALVGSAVAAVGALAGYMLVRSRDLTPVTGRQHAGLAPVATAGSTA